MLVAVLGLALVSPCSIDRKDDGFLDELERAGVLLFWEQADPRTGLVKDRSLAGGNDARAIGSTAAQGFGLTALCIADRRAYIPHDQVLERVRISLRYLRQRLPEVHGFFYHFNDVRTGARVWESELSSIDTAILLGGVLTCRAHFDDPEIRSLARQVYERVDWPWMTNGGSTLTMGWKQEGGFLRSRWDS